MTNKFIVDTNVWVRGSRAQQVDTIDPCAQACFEFLQMIREKEATVVFDQASFDDGREVPGDTAFQELKRNLTDQDYAYDLFWNHLFRNWRIETVELQYGEKGALLPENMLIRQVEPDGKMNPFEPSDLKWIALHVYHPEHPPIYNASDGDWEKARADLEANNIQFHQLCTRRVTSDE